MITEHLVDIFAATVCRDSALPLFICTPNAWHGMAIGHYGIHVRDDGQNCVERHDTLLGKLFGINFALGVTTGITMEFQFGTNWVYYSHYVGDIFGAPLAIEGLMAFFLESTMVGLFSLVGTDCHAVSICW